LAAVSWVCFSKNSFADLRASSMILVASAWARLALAALSCCTASSLAFISSV